MADDSKSKIEETDGATPDGSTTTGSDKDAAEPTVEELKKQLEDKSAHIAKLNKENEQRRKSETELKSKLDARDKTLKEALGIKEDGAEPDAKVKDAKAQADAKAARILLRSAFTAEIAKEAHDADAAFAVLGPKLKDVKVDLDAETVDRDALKAVIADGKKSYSFLFTQPGGGTSTTTKSDPPPDKNGIPAPGPGTYSAKFHQLMRAGNKAEAVDYYGKHQKEIDKGL